MRRTETPFLSVVGLYIEQFCLAALFFFKTSDSIVFIVEGALMVVLMAVTLSMHLLYQRSFERE